MKWYTKIYAYSLLFLTTCGAASAAGDFELKSPLKETSIMELLNTLLVDIVVKLVAPIVVTIAIIYAGFKFVMAAGNPDSIQEAKKVLVSVLIGAFILLGAVVILTVVTATTKSLLAT